MMGILIRTKAAILFTLSLNDSMMFGFIDISYKPALLIRKSKIIFP